MLIFCAPWDRLKKKKKKRMASNQEKGAAVCCVVRMAHRGANRNYVNEQYSEVCVRVCVGYECEDVCVACV